MGYLLNGQHFIKRPGAFYTYYYYGKHYFAIQVSIGAAIFTAFVLHILKLRRKNREHFHHLKLIIFGLILLLLNGSAFLTNDMGIYHCFFKHLIRSFQQQKKLCYHLFNLQFSITWPSVRLVKASFTYPVSAI